MLIYLDTAILIYFYEGVGAFQLRAATHLAGLAAARRFEDHERR